ncbi:hypothetical protein BGX26_007009, partial [Mortierella sp. AD094]
VPNAEDPSKQRVLVLMWLCIYGVMFGNLLQVTRQAPDMFSVELELALPQDHFLPAENIQAQVWTNIIHKLNPDGPEVWSAIPMKLSHVIPGKSIAVFAARFQPTGRGDFGLTARWKAHKDLTEWQWALTNESTSSDSGEQNANKDVSVTVQVPRNISSTSSWTMGPQSVMIFGQSKPRIEGVGGPGLYLGNHAAATRARISGYESVLSLVGDLLDFDEKIPESDKDLHKNVWIEQAQAASPPKRFSLSRPTSAASFSAILSDPNQGGVALKDNGLSRRSSIQEFMVNREPGSVSEEIIAAVVDDPVDPPRLTRKSSVTEMMVQPPASANSSRRLSRTSASMKSISSISEFEQEADQEPSPAFAARAAPAPNASSKPKANIGSDSTNIIATEAAAAGLPPTPPTPPTSVSKKKKKGSSAVKAASTVVSNEKSATKTSSVSQQQSPASPTVSSLEIAAGLDASSSSTASPAISGVIEDSSKKETTTVTSSLSSSFLKLTTNGTDSSILGVDETAASSSFINSTPPSSARVVSGLSHQTWDSQRALASLSSSSSTAETDINKKQPKQPFEHKVISVAPGAHNIISDAALKEAVEFLRTEIGLGKKVLVHCRDGNGRSGSVAIAYIASQLEKNAREADGDTQGGEGGYYDQALREVWKWKCDVYPHKGLRQSVERINW